MLRCVSWEAVSSKRQAGGDKVSLERQREVNCQAIEKIGGVHAVSLVVPGQSRSIILFEDACRKVQAYRQLRELVDTRAIDVLVCYTHSRLGREISLCESVIAYCLAGGVAIYDCCAPPSSLDPNEQRVNAGDRLRSVIRSWESLTEVQRLTKNGRDGVEKRVKNGKIAPGRVPKFYMVRYKENGEKYMIVNEVEANKVKEVYRLYLSGMGEVSIGERMGQSQSWVRYVLNQVNILAGFVEINRRGDRKYIRAKGNHPAIISEETASMITAEFKKRKSTRRPSRRMQYIYSGLGICAQCNCGMAVDRIGKYHYLICHKCRSTRVPFGAIESVIEDWIDTMWREGDEEVMDQTEIEDDPTDEWKAELQKIARSKARLIDLYTQELIEVDEYKKRLQEFGTKEAELSAKVDGWQADQQQTQQRAQQRKQTITAIDMLRNVRGELSTTDLNDLYRSTFRVRCGPGKMLTVQLLS